jgi:hypothetical protein
MPKNTKTNKSLQHRYFLLTAEMLFSEELTKVVIARNANEAEELVDEEVTLQEFSTWDPRGQDIKSALELNKVTEINLQEYLDYKKQFP